MLEIKLPSVEWYNSITEEFTMTKEQTIHLEHSLVSISKWEAKWEKPFLSNNIEYNKTSEESLDYIRCMTIESNILPEIYNNISSDNIETIEKYIGANMSATIIYNNSNKKTNREIITSELIYYWMIAYQIPFECQKWHLNRLLTLINICNIKNAPPTKMSKKAIADRNRALNQKRKSQYNTGG